MATSHPIIFINHISNAHIVTVNTLQKITQILLFAFFVFGCNPNAEYVDDSKLLAEVGNQKLYLSELDGMIPNTSTSEDSSLIINALVERWAREAVMLEEAEQNIPENINIDRLVEDYRSSLLKNNYERLLIEQLLDSLVRKEQIQAFYENHKEQFTLEEPIVRCYFMKMPKNNPKVAEARTTWNALPAEQSIQAIQRFDAESATLSKLDEGEWHEVSVLAQEMPAGFITASNVNSKKSFVKTKDDFTYFFYLIEALDINDTPPIAYLEDRIKRVILHQRKEKLLEEKKAEMYVREMRRNSIKIYE